MADYNFNDINEAKKRVREMQSRVKDKAPDTKSTSLLSLLEALPTQRDRAFMLCVLYILSTEEYDAGLLESILAIFL